MYKYDKYSNVWSVSIAETSTGSGRERRSGRGCEYGSRQISLRVTSERMVRVYITTHVYSYVWHTLLTGEGNGAAPCSRRGQVELHTRSRVRRIIRIRKDTIGGGGVLEIIALGSSLRALRCGKGGKAAGQDCHSSKERGKERLSPLATNQPYLPTICHRDFFSKSSPRTPRFGRR